MDSSVQQYPFQEWDVTGHDLLGLSPQRLDALGVRSIGHQELILEAVEQLCILHYELHSESLRTLTDKLYRVSQSLSSHLLSLRKVSLHTLATVTSPTTKQLVCIIDIVSAARGLFSWLNRYLFTRLNDYSASRDIIALCIELSENLHEDWSDPQVENKILSICQNICGICKSILTYSPENLLNQTATLEYVQIYPEQPDCKLGINIKSTSSGQHFVCGTESESPAAFSDKILTGDEIIKVNEQVVVGWTRENLVRKLLERSDIVTFVLKKVSVAPPQQTASAPLQKFQITSSAVQAHSGHTLCFNTEAPPTPTYLRTPSIPEQNGASSSLTVQSEKDPLCNIADSVLTLPHSTPSTPSKNISALEILRSFSASQETSESYPPSPTTLPSISHAQPITAYPLEQATPQKLPEISFFNVQAETTQHTSRPRSGSSLGENSSLPLSPPANLRHTLSDSNLFNSTNSSPQEEFHGEGSPEKKETKVLAVKRLHRKHSSVRRTQVQPTKLKSIGSQRHPKGVPTKLSRRRVSCRDLGPPDCDGWLWKKKENVSFMSQRWKRCWCVLKGDKMYWYNAPQDETALGLVNVTAYKLESTVESKHKKKYEFQLCHDKYKPFIFAADNLDDMNKWVSGLVKTLQKYKVLLSASHPSEEDCYSETEAEQEPDDDQSRTQEMEKKKMLESPTRNAKGSNLYASNVEGVTATASPDLKGNESHNEGDELKIMISCLQQGGVSLIGTKTTLTHAEYRKSFKIRNKNPEINRKAHTLRVLHSTLKAKQLELEALNQILENPSLSSATFHQWKIENEQLYETIGRGPRTRGSLGDFMGILSEGRREQTQARDENESSDS
uniref:Connector enhancer of kinase suppressor of Ras 1 n=1 Tax=Leptobrachium leishanense TaxID=445787 RepID=A0A8C5M9W7_9ANUR